MKSSSRLLSIGAVVLASLATLSFAAPPETLTVRDMINRPDRWPETVKVNIEGDFGGGITVKKGDSFKLVNFDGSNVVLNVALNQNIAVTPAECDLVEAANKMWSALTPAQRAVDPETLAKDASLWPEKVTVHVEFSLNTGPVIPAETEYDVNAVEPTQVKIYISNPEPAQLTSPIKDTDLIKRAREIALIDPDKRPSRMVSVLKTNMVDAKGEAFTNEKLDATKLFVFYFGASWCGPCRQFSPEFVKYINSVQEANPNMTVVMLNADEDEAEMLKYMQSEKMPFPAVKLKVLKGIGALYGYGCGSIPQLVVTDRYGKVLANTYENGKYLGPKNTFAKLKRMIDAGAAK